MARRRRPLWTLSPDTDRALRDACEAATHAIHQTRQRAHADIRRECDAWAQKKFGSSPRSLAVAARLHAVALWTLESMRAFTLGPMLVVLQALQRHSARLHPSPDEVRELKTHLHKLTLPRQLHDQLLAAARRAARDPYRAAVDRVLSMQDGIGRRFFDHRGRLRTKKLPLIPDLRAVLVTAFRDPETLDRRWGAHPAGLSVTLADAYHLTAICLKAAFPNQFSTLTADGVKQAHRLSPSHATATAAPAPAVRPRLAGGVKEPRSVR